MIVRSLWTFFKSFRQKAVKRGSIWIFDEEDPRITDNIENYSTIKKRLQQIK